MSGPLRAAALAAGALSGVEDRSAIFASSLFFEAMAHLPGGGASASADLAALLGAWGPCP